jgi:AcrR family transcriptional regulator
VPRKVDHDQRRRQIAAALLRIAASRGLHSAGLREVAAEAGVSVRLIQYYFGTKEQLLLFAMQYLAEQFSERVRAQVRAAGLPPDPRTVVEAILVTALPGDEESRTFNVVSVSYAALALTDPALAMAPLIKNSDIVEDVIAAQLSAAQEAGRMPAGLDPRAEAASLLAISAGLGISVLLDQRSNDDALAVIRYQLDRLLPDPPPAT